MRLSVAKIWKRLKNTVSYLPLNTLAPILTFRL